MESKQLIFLSILVIFISSVGTFSLIDSGLINISGAVIDTGALSLTVTGATGCALNSVDGTTNTSIVFTAPPGSTVQTDNGDANGGTLVLNNTGNTFLNVSINSTNTSTVGFFAGSSVSSDYQVKAGHLCEVNGVASNGVTTSYSDVSTNHRQLLADFNFTNGNDSCEIDIKIRVPLDEPVGDKLDRININCTETTYTPPVGAQFTTELLRSSDITTNDTTVDLTAYFTPTLKNWTTYDWRINFTPDADSNRSIAVLNMPFDKNSNSATSDYSSYGNDGVVSGLSWLKPTNPANCPKGGCYNFPDGSDNNIVVAADPSLEVFNNFTIEWWMKLDTSAATRTVIRKNVQLSPFKTNYMLSFGSNNELKFFHRNPSSQSEAAISNDSIIILDEWAHLAVVVKGLNISYYVNGSYVESDVLQYYAGGSGGIVTIGTDWSGTGQFDGQMDEFHIYNKSLSAGQITSIYNNGAPMQSTTGVPLYNLTVSQETITGQNWTVRVTTNDNSTDTTNQLSNSILIR